MKTQKILVTILWLIAGAAIGWAVGYNTTKDEADWNALAYESANKRAEMWRRMTLSYWEQDTLLYGKRDTGYVMVKFVVQTGSPFRYKVTFPEQVPTAWEEK